MIGLAELTERLHGITGRVMRPPEHLPLDQWAEKHRKIATGGSGTKATTPMDLDQTPYLRGVLRAAQDPTVREIRVLKSTQTGYSEGVLNTIALYAVAELNRTLLCLYPTRDDAKKYNERRLVPAILGCARAHAKLASGDKRKAATAMEISFLTSLIFYAYTGGTSQLRSDPVALALLDEVDAYILDAGFDPFESVKSRQETFDDALTVMGSSPKLLDGGIIDRYGDEHIGCAVQHKFMVPCPHCGEYFELFDFERLEWFGGLSADPELAQAEVHVKCEACGSRIHETAKRWMVLNGIWITQGELIDSDGSIINTYDPETHLPTDPAGVCSHRSSDFFRDRENAAWPDDRDDGLEPDEAESLRETLGVRIDGERSTGPTHGFRINRLSSLIAKGGWGEPVYEFVKAGGRMPMTWWAERFATFPQRRARSADHEAVKTLCRPGRDAGVIPEWAIFVVTAVDIQGHCVKAMTMAYGPGMHRRAIVDTAVIARNPDLKLEDPQIFEHLMRHAPKKEIAPNAARPVLMIDTGFYTVDAYRLIDRIAEARLEAGGEDADVWAVKGATKAEANRPFTLSNRSDAREPGTGKRIEGVARNDLVLVNTGMMKDEIVPLLMPIDDEDIRFKPIEMPDAGLWRDACDPQGLVANSVIAELTNEHKQWIGYGSGYSGELGRGARRQAWIKIKTSAPNDFLDDAVYCNAAAYLYRVDQTV